MVKKSKSNAQQSLLCLFIRSLADLQRDVLELHTRAESVQFTSFWIKLERQNYFPPAHLELVWPVLLQPNTQTFCYQVRPMYSLSKKTILYVLSSYCLDIQTCYNQLDCVGQFGSCRHRSLRIACNFGSATSKGLFIWLCDGGGKKWDCPWPLFKALFLTFHSSKMIQPKSSSPAATATSTTHSSISACCSSLSSESMSTVNWN